MKLSKRMHVNLKWHKLLTRPERSSSSLRLTSSISNSKLVFCSNRLVCSAVSCRCSSSRPENRCFRSRRNFVPFLNVQSGTLLRHRFPRIHQFGFKISLIHFPKMSKIFNLFLIQASQCFTHFWNVRNVRFSTASGYKTFSSYTNLGKISKGSWKNAYWWKICDKSCRI